MFKKYQHLERFGTTEVQNIELGECHIFPKIDGTNASVWLHNGEIQAGSRTRHLSLEKDNAGFLEWVLKQENLLNYLKEKSNGCFYFKSKSVLHFHLKEKQFVSLDYLQKRAKAIVY